jgi:hypothetical protein
MYKSLKCKKCLKMFSLNFTEKKASNGAYICYYSNGFRAPNKSHCHPCKKASVRDRWNSDKRADARAYEKTIKGFLVRLYRNMKSRIEGVQKKKHHLYKGKDLLSKDVFYNWAIEHKDFHSLYKTWVSSGYSRKLTPSVDRIDSSKGYCLDNMRWLTHSENSRLGSLSKS